MDILLSLFLLFYLDIKNKDTHLCEDNIFDHEEFCNPKDDITKEIPDSDIYNCNNIYFVIVVLELLSRCCLTFIKINSLCYTH